MTTRRRVAALAAVFLTAVSASACSSPGGPDSSVPGTGIVIPDTTAVVADPAPDGTVEDTVRDASEEGEVVPAGHATLTIAARTWTFPQVVCLMGEDAAAVDAEFALSAVADGFELYAEIAPEGDLVTIDDITGVADDPVSLTTSDTTAFLVVDGTNVTASATFVPVGDPDAPGVAGTLEVACV